MNAKKTWAVLLSVVTIASVSAVAGAAGVTPSSAPQVITEAPRPIENILPSSTRTLPDGTIEFISKKDVKQVDGTLIRYITKKLTHPDSTVETETSSVINYADGTRATRTINADGSITDLSEKPLKQADGSIQYSKSQVTRKADGSTETIQTVTDAAGKVISKRSEDKKADKSVIVTIDDGKNAVTLKGQAGAKPTLQVIGKAPAGLPATITINGTTYQVIPA